jgi:hypothetical protein
VAKIKGDFKIISKDTIKDILKDITDDEKNVLLRLYIFEKIWKGIEEKHMDLGMILQTEINSAMISNKNHDCDNGFLECNVTKFESALVEKGYEPLGICKNVPFKPDYAIYSVAFCYKCNGDVYWCHLTEVMWYSLLNQIYGNKRADAIISDIMGY